MSIRNFFTPIPKKEVKGEEVSPEGGKENSPVSAKRRKVEEGPSTPVSRLTSSQKRGLSGDTPISEKATRSPQVSGSTKSKLSTFSSQPETEEWSHLTFNWLKPDKIKDAEGRRPSDADYDAGTLLVPREFLGDDKRRGECTPGHRQWWNFKAANFDVIIFFKVGKFYELYHMDAVVGVSELGLVFMKGNYAHAGFPEIGFERYADMLVQRGYKVARVEQTETPGDMEERNSLSGTKSQVVRREICQILTKGTILANMAVSSERSSSYFLSICEEALPGSSCVYGVSFVDTAVGRFYVGMFHDDRCRSRLRTLVSLHRPSQVLFEKNFSSPETLKLFSGSLHGVLKESVAFPTSVKTLRNLAEKDYFPDGMPGALEWLCEGGVRTQPREGCDLPSRALGALVSYLERCLISDQLLAGRSFERFVPPDEAVVLLEENDMPAGHLVLDSITLNNLDVLANSQDGGREGTLLHLLDTCSTQAGSRLLRQWLCSPPCCVSVIKERQLAITDLQLSVQQDVRKLLKKLPDLEKVVQCVQGNALKLPSHPDSRAIFFEDLKYRKKRVEHFFAALDGFRQLSALPELFNAIEVTSSLLRKLVTMETAGGRFPHLEDELDFFSKSFNATEARETGLVTPQPGINPDYDEAKENIDEIKAELEDELRKWKKKLDCSRLCYMPNNVPKMRYQMEIPESLTKSLPQNLEFTSQKKGLKRYRSGDMIRLLAALIKAEDAKNTAMKDTVRCFFSRFASNSDLWRRAIQCAAALDCLISLAGYSYSEAGMITPEFDATADTPYLEMTGGAHPVLLRQLGSALVPNDCAINARDAAAWNHAASLLLITGPNMGGKSTLMRQVGLLTILAHLGCRVPATSMRLTPVDRIFTRLGASDNIMAGESTFYVEVSETALTLKHASRHSLVLLDELGRGTATYDGTAIAFAVIKDLPERLHTRTLFSTHYHSLVEDFSHYPNVALGHLACIVEDGETGRETITFLYKFIAGACPKSYGFNAAALAGLPESLVLRASAKAAELEQRHLKLALFRQLVSGQVPVAALTRQLEAISCD